MKENFGACGLVAVLAPVIGVYLVAESAGKILFHIFSFIASPLKEILEKEPKPRYGEWT